MNELIEMIDLIAPVDWLSFLIYYFIYLILVVAATQVVYLMFNIYLMLDICGIKNIDYKTINYPPRSWFYSSFFIYTCMMIFLLISVNNPIKKCNARVITSTTISTETIDNIASLISKLDSSKRLRIATYLNHQPKNQPAIQILRAVCTVLKEEEQHEQYNQENISLEQKKNNQLIINNLIDKIKL